MIRQTYFRLNAINGFIYVQAFIRDKQRITTVISLKNNKFVKTSKVENVSKI